MSNEPTNQTDDTRCGFATAHGRCCRNLPQPGTRFCTSHGQLPTIPAGHDPVFLDELFGTADDAFNSPDGLHAYLRRLSRAVAAGRLDSRQANALAYIGQLLVSSIPHVIEDKEKKERQRVKIARLRKYGLSDVIV